MPDRAEVQHASGLHPRKLPIETPVCRGHLRNPTKVPLRPPRVGDAHRDLGVDLVQEGASYEAGTHNADT